jgi:nucleotide-binding universal stress UspA family protein
MTLVAATGDIQLHSVLIATDFSEASEKALRHALAIARHYGAKLYIVHIVSSLGFTLVGPDAVNMATEIVWRDARELENRLVRNGVLAGLSHEVIVRQGNIWDELDEIIDEERVELVVIGTHARRGIGKLLLGSVAEHIFRRAGCLVLTVGPGSLEDSAVGSARAIRPFLFATDFSGSSLDALPYAISAANHFATQLVLLHVAPEVPLPKGVLRPFPIDVVETREGVRILALSRLQELTRQNPKLVLEPECVVDFGAPAEKILETAERFKTDAIFLGLHSSARTAVVSHMPWATAYDVVCRAGCSVLTVRC